MIHDPDELGHDKYNSNFSVHSHLTSRKTNVGSSSIE